MEGSLCILYVPMSEQTVNGREEGNSNPAADFTVACTHAVTKVRRSGAFTKERERNLGTPCHFSSFQLYDRPSNLHYCTMK